MDSYANPELVTIWSRWKSGGTWVVERTYARHYAETLLSEVSEASKRTYAGFPKGVDPNDHDGPEHDWETCSLCVTRAKDVGMLGPDATPHVA